MGNPLKGGWATIRAYSITPFLVDGNEYEGCMFLVEIIITGSSYLFAQSALFKLLTFDWFNTRSTQIDAGYYL